MGEKKIKEQIIGVANWGGLVVNFNVVILKDDICRIFYDFSVSSVSLW